MTTADQTGPCTGCSTCRAATTPGDDRGRELAEQDVTATLSRLRAVHVDGVHAFDLTWWVGGWSPDGAERTDTVSIARVARFLVGKVAAALAAPAETEAEAGGERKCLAELLDTLDGAGCVFWACQGPDEPYEDMVTCRVCAAVQSVRARLAAFPPAQGPAETEAGDLPELWWSPELGPIVRESRQGSAFYGEYRPANTVRWMTELPADARRLALTATPPAPEGEAGSGTARRGLGDPYPIAQAIDGVTADLDASLSPRVDLVRVLLDVANTYVDRLIVEARTWTPPAPAGPQAEGAGGVR